MNSVYLCPFQCYICGAELNGSRNYVLANGRGVQITCHGESGAALRILTRLFSETSMYGELLFLRVCRNIRGRDAHS